MRKLLLLFAAMVLGLAYASAEATWVASAQGYENAEEITSIKVGDVTVDFAKGTNSNAPKYYTTGTAVRVYGGNTMTFTAPEGHTLIKVVFSVPSSNKFNAETEATVGEFDVNNATWTGDASTFTITNGGTSGHARIQSITVYLDGESTDLPAVDSLNAIYDDEFPSDVQFIVDMPLTVVYENNGNIYVWDAQSQVYGLIYKKNSELTPGDVIAAGWVAMKGDQNENVQLNTEDILKADGTADVPQPIVCEEASVVAINMANQYLCLMGVEIAETPADKGFTGILNGEEVAFYNKFNVEIEAGTYNITGFVNNYKGSAQFYPTAVEAVEEETPVVDNLNALVGAPTEVPFIMDCDLQVIYQAGDELSIVTDGTTNMPAYFEDAEIEANDIVKGGYQAMLSDEIGFDFIYALEPVEIEKGGEPVQPKEYTAEDATSAQSEWGYVCINGVELDEEAVETFNDGDAAIVYINDENMFLVGNGLNDMNLEIPAPGKYNIVGFWMPLPGVTADELVGPRFMLAPITIYDAVVTLDSFTALADIPAGEEFTVGCNTTVVYSDESGFTVLQDPDGNNAAVNLDGVQATDVIGAGWIGMAEESSMILIMNEDELEILPGYGKEIEPKEYDVYDIAGTQAPWQYVKILNVYLDEDAIEELQDGKAATEEMIIFNALNVDVEALTEGVYNITGFWMQGESVSVNEETQAVYALLPIAFEVAPEVGPIVIEDFNALCDFPDFTIVTLGFEPTVVANYLDFIYMLWDGQNYMPYTNYTATWEETIKAGDKLATDWAPMFIDENNGFTNVIDFSTYETHNPEVASSGAELPTPIPVEAEQFDDVANTPWGFFTLMGAEYTTNSDDEAALMFAGKEIAILVDFGDMPAAKGTYNVSGFLKNTGKSFIFWATKYDKATGINGIGVDDNDAEYYNLQGVKVSKPAAGRAYIRVQNGRATKIVK